MTKEKIAERLKAARINAGFRTAREAASSLGAPYQTYAAHENGHRAFDNQAAAQYARRFRISTDWLLSAKGPGPEGAPIRGNDEIRSVLERIGGLKPADVTVLLSIIDGFQRANAAAPQEQARPDDQSAPATPRREWMPSR